MRTVALQSTSGLARGASVWATAADNIDRSKLDDLRAQEQIMRQEEITDELLDVLGGALALE